MAWLGAAVRGRRGLERRGLAWLGRAWQARFGVSGKVRRGREWPGKAG